MSDDDTTTNPPTITLPAASLYQVLHNASLFTSNDTTRLALTGIQLVAGGGELTAVGTDSYVMGTDTVKASVTGDWQPVVIEARSEAFKFVLRVLKGAKTNPEVTFTYDQHDQDRRNHAIYVKVHDDIIWVQVIDANFPNWQTLIPERDDNPMRDWTDPDGEGQVRAVPAGVANIRLDAAQLAKFAKITGDKVHTGSDRKPLIDLYLRADTKPVRVDCGSFVGLIQPVRR